MFRSQPLEPIDYEPVDFQTQFAGCMEMYHHIQTVADYLAAHEGWFCHCAKPMQAEALGDNGYILTIGRFGAFGYEVEPKMGVILEPPTDYTYLMYSVPVPNYDSPGYAVDYKATMYLTEVPVTEAAEGIEKIFRRHKQEVPEVITQVTWQLDLKVSVTFPQFIHKLPLSLIQKTGDRVLAQIIRQVSPRLTLKVQKDFHERFGLPLPSKEGRKFQRVECVESGILS